ncbi:hypothetical protein D3C80_1587560 [compost metagenome]
MEEDQEEEEEDERKKSEELLEQLTQTQTKGSRIHLQLDTLVLSIVSIYYSLPPLTSKEEKLYSPALRSEM